MHTNSKLLFDKFARPLFRSGIRVLEIGPDSYPSTFQKMVSMEEITWDTLDICDSPSLTYAGSPLYFFPIQSDTYDIVLSGQVIEHVARIWQWMRELARVTRPNGLVITINPISWPYHEAPIDCWRIYPEGMKALCEDAGLSIERTFGGSLELPKCRRYLPGRSPEHQPEILRLFFSIAGLFGFPVEKSFDTITIARKRSE